MRDEAEYKGAGEAERLAARRCRDAEGVTVTVNGRRQETDAGETVESLLERLGLAARYALVERNGEPVERDRYADTALAEGDSLVVARPVAGG
jgi:thiamine biosynthesis protein ThiS